MTIFVNILKVFAFVIFVGFPWLVGAIGTSRIIRDEILMRRRK